MKHYLAALTLLGAFGAAGAQGTNPLSHFTMLSVPRQDIPIGAVWQQGTGPDGDGLPVENLRVSSSLTAFTSNQSARQQAGARILRWLNLSADLASATRIEFDSVALVTVADLGRSNAQPGNYILYEGLRVGAFRLETTAARVADLAVAVRSRMDTSRVGVTVGSNNSIKLVGTNLFVGYRVVTLRNPQTTVTREDLDDGAEDASSTLHVGQYTFKFDTRNAYGCACPDGIGPAPRSCRASMTVTADNPQLGSILTGGLHKQFRWVLNDIAQAPVLLDARPQSGAFEVDRFELEEPSLNIDNSCMMVGKAFRRGKAKVTRVRYHFSPLASPSAPGW